MAKEKFVYNKQTLRYEKVEVSLSQRAFKWFLRACAVLFAAFIIVVLAFNFIDSPKEKVYKRELEQANAKYESLNKELSKVEKVLKNLNERDGSVYRHMFGMAPIDKGIWEGGVGGRNKYKDLEIYKNTGGSMISTSKRLDKLKSQLTIQSKSLDTIVNQLQNKEKMYASIPSIKPVREDKLKRSIHLLSGFGWRIHPIHRVRKMHTGIDFTSPTGTPIYATGDGTIVRVQHERRGYGLNVIIDHGYGYKTLYAHMSKSLVKKGQKIKKGEKIGLVGTTGTSTAPHLHYEVMRFGKKVNPIDYCLDKLTPQEYKQLVDLATERNISFD
jgi:murein DD-endopeptidase MepM/ murein hydrolase activator NlpD